MLILKISSTLAGYCLGICRKTDFYQAAATTCSLTNQSTLHIQHSIVPNITFFLPTLKCIQILVTFSVIQNKILC